MTVKFDDFSFRRHSDLEPEGNTISACYGDCFSCVWMYNGSTSTFVDPKWTVDNGTASFGGFGSFGNETTILLSANTKLSHTTDHPDSSDQEWLFDIRSDSPFGAGNKFVVAFDKINDSNYNFVEFEAFFAAGTGLRFYARIYHRSGGSDELIESNEDRPAASFSGSLSVCAKRTDSGDFNITAGGITAQNVTAHDGREWHIEAPSTNISEIVVDFRSISIPGILNSTTDLSAEIPEDRQDCPECAYFTDCSYCSEEPTDGMPSELIVYVMNFPAPVGNQSHPLTSPPPAPGINSCCGRIANNGTAYYVDLGEGGCSGHSEWVTYPTTNPGFEEVFSPFNCHLAGGDTSSAFVRHRVEWTLIGVDALVVIRLQRSTVFGEETVFDYLYNFRKTGPFDCTHIDFIIPYSSGRGTNGGIDGCDMSWGYDGDTFVPPSGEIPWTVRVVDPRLL